MRSFAACPTSLPQRAWRAAAAAFLTATTFVGFAALAPTPAAAHGPNGLFQVQPSTVVAPLTVRFRVRLIYTNDTEPVTSGATVTVQGSGPGGSVGPVQMSYTGTDGYYTADIAFPTGGSWAITYRSVNPAAQYAATETVPSPAPPPTAPPPTQPPPPPSNPAPSTIETSTTTTAEAAITELPVTTESLPPPTIADDTEEIAETPASTRVDAGYDAAFVGLGALIALVVLGGSALLGKVRGS